MTVPTGKYSSKPSDQGGEGPFIKLDLPDGPSVSMGVKTNAAYRFGWDDPRKESPRDMPDHLIDAMRYSLARKFTVRGYYCIGEFKIAVNHRPAWHKRFLMEHLLGWVWEEA